MRDFHQTNPVILKSLTVNLYFYLSLTWVVFFELGNTTQFKESSKIHIIRLSDLKRVSGVKLFTVTRAIRRHYQCGSHLAELQPRRFSITARPH